MSEQQNIASPPPACLPSQQIKKIWRQKACKLSEVHNRLGPNLWLAHTQITNSLVVFLSVLAANFSTQPEAILSFL